MGGLVGIGFSIRINPIQKFMSLSLHLDGGEAKCLFRVAEHKSRCALPEQPTGCS